MISPKKKPRKSNRITIFSLLLLLITFGILMGISMGALIAGRLNRWPTVTILIPQNEVQVTETFVAFKDQFKSDIYKRITQLAQTKTPVGTVEILK